MEVTRSGKTGALWWWWWWCVCWGGGGGMQSKAHMRDMPVDNGGHPIEARILREAKRVNFLGSLLATRVFYIVSFFFNLSLNGTAHFSCTRASHVAVCAPRCIHAHVRAVGARCVGHLDCCSLRLSSLLCWIDFAEDRNEKRRNPYKLNGKTRGV